MKRALSVCAAVAAFSLASITAAYAAPTSSNQEMRARGSFEQSDQKSTAGNIQFDSSTTLQKDISPQDRRAISVAAGRLLAHVVEAREALQKNNHDGAVDNVNKALTLAQIIENNVPVYRVNTSIQSGSLQYQNDDQVKATMVPIYTELEKVSLVAPIKQAKSEAAQTGLRVADADLAVTSVSLDIAISHALLDEAQRALKANNTTNADKALIGIERSVVLNYAAADLPLMKVRENLALAKIYAQDGRTAQAQALLKTAATSLDTYSKNVGESRSKDVADLKKEIESEQRSPEQSQNLAQKISGWWDRVTAWM